MIFTADNLKLIVEQLWSDRTIAAQAVGCSPRTLKRYITGETSPSSRVCGMIRRAISARMSELMSIGAPFLE